AGVMINAALHWRERNTTIKSKIRFTKVTPFSRKKNGPLGIEEPFLDAHLCCPGLTGTNMYLAISTFSRYVLLFLDSFVIRQRKKEVLHKARNLFMDHFYKSFIC
ncbi:MAG TPA: hypothetical protein PKX45_10235, partial [Bacillota bacterium]|nr:hypothetical protein [Bacillota bacterium]